MCSIFQVWDFYFFTQACTTDRVGMPHPDAGVLFVLFLPSNGTRRIIRECAAANIALHRTMTSPFPVDLLANEPAQKALASLPAREERKPHWDSVRTLTLHPRLQRLQREPGSVSWLAGDSRNAYLHKLSGLMQTRFRRTLFLDCDVFVISPALVSGLLVDTLNVADIAMPLDPGRAAHLVPTSGKGKGEIAPWAAPAVGPPMLCSAMLAYRSTNGTADLFVGAGRRLVRSLHPNVRQGDQEMMWFEWTRGATSRSNGSALRVLALPEEYYCPLERRQNPDADWQASRWRTSWRRGVYPCAAVHGHIYAQTTSRRKRRAPVIAIRPATRPR
jgi:hypothetical protein